MFPYSTTCPKGEKRVGGRCVLKPKPRPCPKGQKRVGDRCVKNQRK